MSRRELREQIFKLVYRAEFHSREEMAEQEELFFADDELEMSEKDSAYVSEKSNKILDKEEEIDTLINEKTKGWSTERMSKVDLAILRLAVYEILFDEQIPTNVAINEAIEIGKKYGQEESAGFINGVLAKFA